MNQAFNPTEIKKRFVEIDILRGFALIGVLFTNMYMFSSPSDHMVVEFYPKSVSDHLIYFGLGIFAQGKFYTLFSILFGFGFALQINRLKSKKVFLRRMIGLFIIGLIHTIFIWPGDILKFYALFGMLLLVFGKWKTKNKIIVGGVLLGLFTLLILVGMVINTLQPPPLDANVELPQTAQEFEAKLAEKVNEVYRTGTYMEVTKQRISEFLSVQSLGLIILGIFYVFPLFLLGSIFGNLYLSESTEKIKQILKKTLKISLIAAVVMLIPYLYVSYTHFLEFHTIRNVFYETIGNILNLPLSLIYASVLLLVLYKFKHLLIFRSLGYIGRTALTNYVMQSAILTTMAYGYGLNLMETFSISQLFVMSALFFAFQVLMSRLWLKYFKFGPLEWIWRSFTYLKVVSIKK